MSKVKSIVIEPEEAQHVNPDELGRILHLPYNPGGQMSTQALALKKLGVNTSFCSYPSSSKYKYPTDIPSPLIQYPLFKKEGAMLQFCKKNINHYDLFHFHGGQTFTEYAYKDLPFLKYHQKKMVMNFWGSEVRRLSIAKRNNPFAVAKMTDENLIISRLELLSNYFDTAIVPDHELLEYVYGYFKKIYIIRISVDHSKFTPFYPSVQKGKPVVIHAPSDRRLKGTEHIHKAVQQLKNSIDFEYVLIENMSNAQALEYYKKADIVIDQLQLGIYATFAIESMLLGKPVIAYIRDDLKQKYPPDLPIQSASPHTIEQTLYHLLINPKLRYELGVKSRQYALKHHTAQRIARQLVTLYKHL
jgi:glycosyltransferase involved in cell wall biosynthesis